MARPPSAGVASTAVPFELGWLGGASERFFRRMRPGVDELPWGTLDPNKYPPELVNRARKAWTEAAFNEYCTGVALARMLEALLLARAPIDLVGMASDFVADEVLHIELTSRVAMELGGAAPYRFHPDRIVPTLAPGLTPMQQANDWVVRVCCVGEAFSVPMLAGSMQAASHPLTHEVLKRIVQDEGPHGQFGWHYLEWAANDMDDAERTRLAQVALDTLHTLSPLWQRLRSELKDGRTSEGFLIEHVHDLGWMDSESYGQRAREAVNDRVIGPLADFGIELDAEAAADLLK